MTAALVRLWVPLVLLTAMGCDDGTRTLIVEVRTDLAPGVEFVTMHAVMAASGRPTLTIPAVIGQDFINPVRLAEFDGLADGTYELVVTASDATGSAVVARTLRIDLREDLAVTVALSRSCGDISCPATGDAPSLTTCVSGRCVDPSCSELAPELCAPGECGADAECTMGSSCSVGQCVEGGCLYTADDGACGFGETCSLTMGCVDVTSPMDGGTDAVVDTGAPVFDARPDARDSAMDSGPSCGTEVLLASTDAVRSNGNFSGSGFSTMVVVMVSSGPRGIGDEDLLTSGYSGVRDFRASNDSDFDLVVARFMDGSETRPLIDATVPSVVGGGSPANVSAPLRDTLITMVRRNVTSFDFLSAEGRTTYDATSQWEFWGCVPP